MHRFVVLAQLFTKLVNKLQMMIIISHRWHRWTQILLISQIKYCNRYKKIGSSQKKKQVHRKVL